MNAQVERFAPGFRELVIVAHDLDAHCDLVFALVAEGRRRDLFRRPTAEAAELRRAELIDLSGVGREYLVDAVAGALSVPIATDPHPIVFASDASIALTMFLARSGLSREVRDAR